MERTHLGLSLLGGQLAAVGFRHGSPASTWPCPEPIHDFAVISSVLRQAAASVQAEGRQLAMVLSHPQLSEQVVDIPPVKGATLSRLLEKEAQALKAVPGRAVWSQQSALPSKKGSAALLHLFPKAALDQLSVCCGQAQFHLVRVVPASAVLMGQLKQLPLQKDELALLVAETGNSTTVVIGRKDGRVALARVLANSWANAPERVWVDLTRSVGYAEQQFGVTASSAWLFGPGAESQVPSVQAVLKIPVRISPVEYTPFYWAEQAVRLPEKEDGNLISVAEREAPRRKRLLTVTSVIVLMLVALSLAAVGMMEVARQAQLKSIREINRMMTKLEDQKKEWDKKYGEAARKKEFAQRVTEEKAPPLAFWFLGYLGDVVPKDLVLTSLRVHRTNQAWSVQIAGGVPPSTNRVSTNALGQGFAALSNSLVTGPFHLQISRQAVGSQAGLPVKSAVNEPVRPKASALASMVGPADQFLLEGMIR